MCRERQRAVAPAAGSLLEIASAQPDLRRRDLSAPEQRDLPALGRPDLLRVRQADFVQAAEIALPQLAQALVRRQ